MSLPAGATFFPGEQKRIAEAIEALAKDHHAPREITVRLTLHVHHEYPKHVPAKDVKGNAITKIANNAEEEKAILAEAEPAEAETSEIVN